MVRLRSPAPYLGDFPSGQRGQTVNLLSLTSVVRIHHPPPEKRPSRLGSCPKGQFCKNTVYLERGMPYSCFCLSAFGTLDFSHHFNKFLFTGDINKPYRGKVNIKTYLLSSVDLFAIMHFYTPNEPINNGGC